MLTNDEEMTGDVYKTYEVLYQNVLELNAENFKSTFNCMTSFSHLEMV